MLHLLDVITFGGNCDTRRKLRTNSDESRSRSKMYLRQNVIQIQDVVLKTRSHPPRADVLVSEIFVFVFHGGISYQFVQEPQLLPDFSSEDVLVPIFGCDYHSAEATWNQRFSSLLAVFELVFN